MHTPIAKIATLLSTLMLLFAACGSSTPTGTAAAPGGAVVDDEAPRVADDDQADDEASGESDDSEEPDEVGSIAGETVTVTYFDWEWEVNPIFVSASADETTSAPDDDPETDYIQVPVTITNRSVDFGVSGLRHLDVLRLHLPDDDLPVKAHTVWDDWKRDRSEQRRALSLRPEARVERQWSFAVPSGTDPASIVIEIGLAGDTTHLISASGQVPMDPVVPVVLAEQQFGGEYSFNAVDFAVVDSFASLNRGLYDSLAARPGGTDRRADEGHVFVIVELRADQTSTSGVRGVNPGAHEIVTDDGSVFGCAIDAPGLYGAETVTYTASCEVPLDSTSYSFQLRSKKCAGGCDSVDHTIAVDPSFTAAFLGS